jgi:hypothetical protein
MRRAAQASLMHGGVCLATAPSMSFMIMRRSRAS